MSNKLEADYLIIGAGAMGLAFADTLISETDSTIVIVDRYGQPGGHWTTSYPFVRLHQSSAFYGVNSRALGNGTIDQVGWNAGLPELASGHEVCAYFDAVMRQQFLPSGRVQYFPMCEYRGEGRFQSLISGETFEVSVRKRTVDSTYMRVTVPSMRPAPYEVAPGAHCVPLNDLPKLRSQFKHYTVIGAGKTGMDACLWLLWNGANPDDVTWVRPRDPWMFDRGIGRPGPEAAAKGAGAMPAEAQAVAQATSIDDLFERLSAAGRLLRFTDEVKPTMFRCATVTQAELEQLRRITDVVRLGHVQRINLDTMTLDQGIVPTSSQTLHIDCSADGLEKRPILPIFNGSAITLQTVRPCQQHFSAAFIAHVEASYSDDSLKNELCTPVPHPDTDLDWLRVRVALTRNELRWSEEPGLQEWIANSRLNMIGGQRPQMPEEPGARAEFWRQFRAMSEGVSKKLEELLSTTAAQGPAAHGRR